MSGNRAAIDSKPWIQGNLSLLRGVLEEIEAHAVECYPSECCGFVTGPLDSPALLDTSIREVNEADRFHALDPDRFPRTSRTYFKINELRAQRIFENAAKEGRPVKVIYHSHTDAGAYFSAEDAATFASNGQLMWPCAFLVVSVIGGKAVDRRLWIHVPNTDGFIESELDIV